MESLRPVPEQRSPLEARSDSSLGQTASTRSRSTSVSSDFQSLATRSVLLCPTVVKPEPAFIAASAASQIVTADQQHNVLSWNISAQEAFTSESAYVSQSSLSLLNGFLDHLLFNILSAAGSTQLNSIRPAVSEVLKPRLAHEVVAAANEELGEYIGEGEDEEVTDFHGGQEPRGEFELERSWKLARLRCMVYTRLGDLEEEDEDEYIEREGLDEIKGMPRRYSSHVGNITPAAAIFLTAIIEYMGEQALMIAGEAARARILSGKSTNGFSFPARLTVEDTDMEKLALNSTLGRLWRTWRKRVRGPTIKGLSRDSVLRKGLLSGRPGSRQSSSDTIEEQDDNQEHGTQGEPEAQEQIDPTSIPLPMSEYDVAEIEIPGFNPENSLRPNLDLSSVMQKIRPRSLVLFPPNTGSPTPATQDPQQTTSQSNPVCYSRHIRSRSMPTTPAYGPATTGPLDGDGNDTGVGASNEEPDRLETMVENDEAEEPTVAPVEEVPLAELTGLAISSDEVHPASRPQSTTPGTNQYIEPAHDDDAGGAAFASAMMGVPMDGNETTEGQGVQIAQQARKGEKPTTVFGRTPSRSVSSGSELQKNEIGRPELGQRGLRHILQSQAGTQGAIRTTTFQRRAHDDPWRKNTTRASSNSATVASQADASITNAAGSSDVPHPGHGKPAEKAYSISSQHTANQSDDGANPPSVSGDSNYSQPSRHRSQSSIKNVPRSVPSASPPVERAAVQRLTPPPGPPAAPRDSTSKPRRSESISSSRDRRPPTSGSTTSQVSNKLRGLVGFQPGEDGPPLPSQMRGSIDDNSRTSRSTVADDRSELDKLIHSDETIHYTLTPRSVRGTEYPDSPRSELANDASSQRRSPPIWQSQHSVSSPGLKGLNGLRANPPDPATIPPRPAEQEGSPSTSTITRTKSQVAKARDARPETGSMQDFANFIKSTGPERPDQLPTPLSPTLSRPSVGSQPDGGRSSPRTGSPAVVRQRSTKSINSKKSDTSRKGPRLQARSAVVPKDDPTSDLIDFIREGPPRAAGAHRIPRTVAPFRSTMDSDDISLDTPRAEKFVPSSTASTVDESNVSRSVPSSSNSRTALVTASNGTKPRAPPVATNKALPSVFSADFEGPGADDGLPQRKQRRVKDPYAISDSEDELDGPVEAPKKPRRQEESLMDFLRNAPPPPEESTPQPFVINGNPAVPPKSAGSSKVGMRSRFFRSASIDKFPTTKESKSSLRSQPAATSGPSGFAPASSTSYGASPRGPQYPVDGYGSKHATSQSPMRRQQSARVATQPPPRTTRPVNAGPRPINAAPAVKTSTSDLADFLMNTGPPEPVRRAESPPSIIDEEKDVSGFARFFMRKKKVGA